MKRVFTDIALFGVTSGIIGSGVFANRIKVDIMQIMEKSLTKRQKSYILLYYSEKMTIPEIATLCGVNKSTVSRTMKRGMKKIERTLGMVS